MKNWNTTGGYRILRLMGGRSNVFLLSDGKMNILVDTSVKRLRSRLFRRLDRLNVTTIDFLILTHAHFDHAANAKAIKRKYQARVLVHREEAACLAAGNNIVPNGTLFFTKIMMNLAGKRLFRRFNYEPCSPDVLVDSAFDLNQYGFNAHLVHNPGHTAGSMSLIVDNEIACVGDALFGVFPGSVFPPFAQDSKLLVKSWAILLDSGCRLFLPSHGKAVDRKLVQKEFLHFTSAS